MNVKPTSAGVCRFCRCSDRDACCILRVGADGGAMGVVGCHWIDQAHTVCSACLPALKAEAVAVAIYGKLLTAPLLLAYHQGFVTGWFQQRGNFRRNPYLGRRGAGPPRAFATYGVWDRGLLAGTAAGQQYRSACGPLDNAIHRRARRTRATGGRR